MAAGLPVVANPVGVHPDMIRHGETGLLASTHERTLEIVPLEALAEHAVDVPDDASEL